MEKSEIIEAIKGGKKIKAKVKPEYNHKMRRVFTRLLRIQKNQYAEGGFDIYIITPVFAHYIIKISEIIEIL